MVQYSINSIYILHRNNNLKQVVKTLQCFKVIFFKMSIYSSCGLKDKAHGVNLYSH